ncbi:hypothetical protein [Argonema galeatum]|uniref:hypothetical protein n=1 Tax=Argonema galeatum TaxID=2942762 RepID=UPI0020130EF9|nr:hypothetical protein [Argonema galeatum]MCL1464372.1 hypothetical protein [Argonema galeatum A003/A1]
MLRKSSFLPIAAAISVTIVMGTESAKAYSLYPNPCKNNVTNPSGGGSFNPSDPNGGGFDFDGNGTTRNIPESSTAWTLVALGVIGTGALLKHSRKSKFKKRIRLELNRVNLSQQGKQVFQPKETNFAAVVPPIDNAEDGEIQWLEFFKAS